MDEDYEQFSEEAEVIDEEEHAGPEGAFMRGYNEANKSDNEDEDEED